MHTLFKWYFYKTCAEKLIRQTFKRKICTDGGPMAPVWCSVTSTTAGVCCSVWGATLCIPNKSRSLASKWFVIEYFINDLAPNSIRREAVVLETTRMALQKNTMERARSDKRNDREQCVSFCAFAIMLFCRASLVPQHFKAAPQLQITRIFNVLPRRFNTTASPSIEMGSRSHQLWHANTQPKSITWRWWLRKGGC